MRISCFLALGFVCFVMAGASAARATPKLQLYVEGATYNSVTESWELAAGSSDPIRLWTIGNVNGPGGAGSIADVRLSIAYEAVAVAPTITLTPTTAGGVGAFNGFVDPSTPLGTGTWIQTVTDGSSPLLGDGSSLPDHGIFGAGTHWQEFDLGDFTLEDSQIADFINVFPDATGLPATGQINVYEVSVLNASGILHFDLYDTIVASNHVKFAPFSHDASIVPVPGAAALAFLGLGLVGFARKHRV